MSKEKLKPCPFCGYEAEVRDKPTTYSLEVFHEVWCKRDGCYLETGADYNFDTEYEAITAWNTRK